MPKPRVVVAKSGGVDSAVTAYLLTQQEYDVEGITMRLSPPQAPGYARQNKRCCTAEDTDDARRVCRILGIPHYVMNFEKEFHTHVIKYFLDEYRRGRTPNPCLACNDKVKFQFLMNKTRALGAYKLATGHYARIDQVGERYRLLKSLDSNKDQSYVLFGLGQKELSQLLFPVGEYPKSGIRDIARRLGLPVADKPDSQDICFIPDGDYRGFVSKRVQSRPGVIVDASGRRIGEHPGIEAFTIGQRKGLGAGSGTPRYVTKIDPEENLVVVGNESDLYSAGLRASSVRYTSDTPPPDPVQVTVKIRHRAPEVEAMLVPQSQEARVWFHQPQRAVAPGQAVVFYQGEEVLGGGIIEEAFQRPAEDFGQQALESAHSTVSV